MDRHAAERELGGRRASTVAAVAAVAMATGAGDRGEWAVAREMAGVGVLGFVVAAGGMLGGLMVRRVMAAVRGAHGVTVMKPACSDFPTSRGLKSRFWGL